MVLRKHLPSAGGLEGVAVMDDLRLGAGSFPDNRDDVESRQLLEQAVSFQEGQRQPCELRLLVRVNRFVRLAGGVRTAGLDFNKNDARSIAGYQVDLPHRSAVTSRHDLVPLAAQIARRQPLSLVSQPACQPSACGSPEYSVEQIPDGRSGEDARELHGLPPARGSYASSLASRRSDRRVDRPIRSRR